jgi:hypothetical protein
MSKQGALTHCGAQSGGQVGLWKKRESRGHSHTAEWQIKFKTEKEGKRTRDTHELSMARGGTPGHVRMRRESE